VFGGCRVCLEKEKRIADLQQELAFMRSMVSPPIDNSSVPFEELEANLVMDGQQDVITIDRDFELSREVDRIFSGNYDEQINDG
jgi:hypothetical protein